MLKVRELTKEFGDVKALDKLSLEINENSLYGLLGQNGAGKTTLMRVLSGLIDFSKGEVFIDGLDIKNNLYEVKKRIAYIPDSFGNNYNLSVYEYMDFFASAYNIVGLNARKKIYSLLERVALSDKLDFNVDSLSRGMKQRLSFARALLHDPKFLIMDEPTSGMDPSSRKTFKEMLRQLSEEGLSILISSHILSELQDFCTDIGIIDSGKMIASGNILEIIESIENSNPLEVKILQGFDIAMDIFKKNKYVSSISFLDNTFMLGFEGDKIAMSTLLYELISNEIPVLSFVREVGSLESFFMQMTSKDKEKILLKNEY